MFDHRRAANVRAEIIRLSQEGLDSRSLRAQAMRKLRCVIAVDSFWFATADPETLLFTDSLVENIPEAATPLFVANELLQDDVNKWVCAVTRRRFPVGANPTRRMLQPEAAGAAMEVTK